MYMDIRARVPSLCSVGERRRYKLSTPRPNLLNPGSTFLQVADVAETLEINWADSGRDEGIFLGGIQASVKFKESWSRVMSS